MLLERSLEILDRLIAFPTISSDSNLELIGYSRSLLSAAGARTQIVHDETGAKANLYARVGPPDGAAVLLSAHTDVVPVAGQAWTTDPFRLTVRDNRLFGRGTTDMKGFAACALAAVETAASSKLSRPIHLALSYDEEVGCVGVRRLLDVLALSQERPAMCIVGEPTGMQPVIGHKGKIAGRVTCVGRECHSSEAPSGLNAIHLAVEMIGRMREIQERIEMSGAHDPDFSVPVTTVHVGTIHGGTALNIVPGQCVVDFEIRNVPMDDSQEVLREIVEHAEAVTQRATSCFPGCGVNVEIVSAYPALATAPDEQIVALVSEWSGSSAISKASFGTEAGLFRERLGIPTVVCGPGDVGQAHKPDEFLTLEQMGRCAAMLQRAQQWLAT